MPALQVPGSICEGTEVVKYLITAKSSKTGTILESKLGEVEETQHGWVATMESLGRSEYRDDPEMAVASLCFSHGYDEVRLEPIVSMQ
jgi:hypothetical protein